MHYQDEWFEKNCLKPVETVEQYLRRVGEIYQKIQNTFVGNVSPQFKPMLWFRGLATTAYNLRPSIDRGDYNPEYEIIFLSKFKSMAIPYLEKLPGYPFDAGRPSYWGWLFLMQHYGLPTRLLDWSQDALAALLFAAHNRTAQEREQDAIVWLLDPVKLNESFNLYNFLPKGYIPNVQEEKVYELFGPDSISTNKKSIAAIGPLNSTRISAQKGVFTIYPHDEVIIPINEFPDSNQYLFSITIANSATDNIMKQLNSYGITYASLFPEIDKIAQQINEEGIFVKH